MILEAPLDFLNRNKFVVGIEKARYKEAPSNYTKLTAGQIEQINQSPRHSALMPRQEQGISLHVHFRTSYMRTGVSVKTANIMKSASALEIRCMERGLRVPRFNVYLRNTKEGSGAGGGMMAATYAVKPGDILTRQYPFAMFTDTGYAIEVHGPNGFYRSFTGRAIHAMSRCRRPTSTQGRL